MENTSNTERSAGSTGVTAHRKARTDPITRDTGTRSRAARQQQCIAAILVARVGRGSQHELGEARRHPETRRHALGRPTSHARFLMVPAVGAGETSGESRQRWVPVGYRPPFDEMRTFMENLPTCFIRSLHGTSRAYGEGASPATTTGAIGSASLAEARFTAGRCLLAVLCLCTLLIAGCGGDSTPTGRCVLFGNPLNCNERTRSECRTLNGHFVEGIDCRGRPLQTSSGTGISLVAPSPVGGR